MEFRTYDKINCSEFDLISGDLEVKQTMALGFLFSKSDPALSAFLKLINISLQYDKGIIDCEAQKKQTANNGRIDILIRFYNKNNPVQAIIVEAKSVRSGTGAYAAGQQVSNYTNFPQLQGFQNIVRVTITRNLISPYNGVISITWSQLISALYKSIKRNQQNYIIKSFIHFILNIEGNMNYYEEEILSIPAGMTINTVLQTGIYVCPISYNTHKKSLYLAFRSSGKGKNGEMDKLFKLKEIFELDLNDISAINIIDRSYTGFANRISEYKKQLGYPNTADNQMQVYLLDLVDTIDLSIPVRPVENNTSPIYYSLKDFIQNSANSNINKIVVQKNIRIDDNDVLHISTNGKKTYTLFCNQVNPLASFSSNSTYQLDKSKQYSIRVQSKNKSVQLKSINLNFKNGKWDFEYVF